MVHILHLAVNVGDLVGAGEHLLVDAGGEGGLVLFVADIVLK